MFSVKVSVQLISDQGAVYESCDAGPEDELCVHGWVGRRARS